MLYYFFSLWFMKTIKNTTIEFYLGVTIGIWNLRGLIHFHFVYPRTTKDMVTTTLTIYLSHSTFNTLRIYLEVSYHLHKIYLIIKNSRIKCFHTIAIVVHIMFCLAITQLLPLINIEEQN